MTKFRLILTDALILFAVSTVFVYLVDKGFSGLKGQTAKNDPLVTAIMQNKIDSLKELVGPGTGATRQTDDHGRTALMRAAYANYSDVKLTAETDTKRAEMIPLLVEHGAPLDARDHDGWSALMWASWSGLHQVAEKLLALGASQHFTDKQGNTALIIAAQRGNAGIVKSLLAKGADKAVTNKAGQSALEAARTGLAQYPEQQADYAGVISQLTLAKPAAGAPASH